MQFNTAQVLSLTGITVEKLRYWKSRMRPIAQRDGRKRPYLLEEVVALSAVNEVVARLGGAITILSEFSEELFDGVAAHVHGGGEPNILYVTAERLEFGALRSPPEGDSWIAVRIDQLTAAVRLKAMSPEIEQLPLL